MFKQPEYCLFFPVLGWLLFIFKKKFLYAVLMVFLGIFLLLLQKGFVELNIFSGICIFVYYFLGLAIPYYYANYWREKDYQCQLNLLPLNTKEKELLQIKSQQQELLENLQRSLDNFFEHLLLQQGLVAFVDIKQIFQQLNLFFQTNFSSDFYLGLYQQKTGSFNELQLLLENRPETKNEVGVFSSEFPVDRQTKFQLVLKGIPTEKIEETIKYSIGQIQLALRRAYLYQTFQERSRHDELTGLYLRRYFLERLNEEIQRAKRYSEKFILLMLDIDYFKKINDEKGHLFGDEILRQLGKILKTFSYPGSQWCRYGGEEFLGLLPNYPENLSRTEVAEKLRREISENMPITVSIGVAEYPRDGKTQKDLLDFSDKALYQAKASGRNRVV